MYRITNLLAHPYQVLNLYFKDANGNSDSFVLILKYLSTQELWSYEIIYNGKIIEGSILTCSENILYKFRKILPFGLKCESIDKGEPFYLGDFKEGRINLYVLDYKDKEVTNQWITNGQENTI